MALGDQEPRIGGESPNCPRCGIPLNDPAHEVLPGGTGCRYQWKSQTGGESGNGEESVTLATVDANRRRVLVMWLRDVDLEGCADNLAAETGNPAHVAYEIADQAENELPGGVSAPLVWHLRDWADQHEKLGKETT